MRIAIAGASGRMGRMLTEAVTQSADLKLTAALDIAGAPMLGQDATAFLGKLSGVLITDQLSAKSIGIVFAPNMSVGVNATLKLLDMAARILNAGYDVEVFEAHHHHKVDAPSGTALKMGEVVADAWGKKLDDVATWTRHGHTGARKPGEIGFSVVRGGDIVGDHTVYFCGVGERIEITHRSSSRAGYAEGGLRAARYLEGKKTGLFNMQTVLGL